MQHEVKNFNTSNDSTRISTPHSATTVNSNSLKTGMPPLFNNYRKQGKEYEVFKVENDNMNNGRWKDTPKNAIILGEKVNDIDSSKYGYILKLGNVFVFRDVVKTKGKIKTTTRSSDLVEYFNKSSIECIYKVTKRSF